MVELGTSGKTLAFVQIDLSSKVVAHFYSVYTTPFTVLILPLASVVLHYLHCVTTPLFAL